MSDANRMRLSYGTESTFNTNPGGAFQIARYTGESLGVTTATVTSSEIRSDRAIADVARSGLTGGGDVQIELPYGAHDELFQAALLSSAWTSEDDDIAGANTTSVNGSNVYTIDASTWSTQPSVGDWLEIRGSAQAANNGYKYVTASTTTTFTVAGAATSSTSGEDLTIDHLGYISAGTTLTTIFWEKTFQDLTSKAYHLGGFAPQTFNISVSTGAIATGSFGFLGKSMTFSSSDAGSSYTAANSNPVMNAIDHIESCLVANASYDTTQFTIALNNNLRDRQQIKTLGPVSIGTGTINLTGTHQAYFDDETEMGKYLAFTDSSIAYVFQDTAGNGYIFHIPAVNYSSGSVNATAINTDILADMAWTAKFDSTTSQTFRISRFTA